MTISNFPKTKPAGSGKRSRAQADADARKSAQGMARARKRLPATDWPPGHFTSGIRRASKACPEGFPPRFEPTTLGDYTDTFRPAHATREAQLQAGHESARGTIAMANTPTNAPPGWIKERE